MFLGRDTRTVCTVMRDLARSMAHSEARDDEALAALVASPSVAEAARKSGIPLRTLFHRLTDPEFKQRLVDMQREVMDVATLALQGATEQAVATLVRNFSCGMPSAEIRAAQVVLDQAFKSKELEIEMRVTALEVANAAL